MDHKAVVVAVDVGGGIWLKLDGDIGHGSIELEVGLGAAVLTHDICCQVISIVEGQKVILTNTKAKRDKNK